MTQPANYSIRKNEADQLLLQDNGPWTVHASITNDASNVVKKLYKDGYLANGKRLSFIDGDDYLHEIVHENGVFKTFRFSRYKAVRE